jgi:hypothetical protein
VDETYIRVKGKAYLYRAVDSSGATIDFLLSAKHDAAAAERFLGRALGGENHPAPRVINTDEHAGYPPAIVRLKSVSTLEEKILVQISLSVCFCRVNDFPEFRLPRGSKEGSLLPRGERIRNTEIRCTKRSADPSNFRAIIANMKNTR